MQITIKRNDLLVIGCIAILARVAWMLFSGLGPEAGVDYDRWNTFSDNILQGNFNLETQVVDDPSLDTRLFIAAPFFPYFFAAAKLVFGQHWFLFLASAQIILSAISTAFLAAAAGLIFQRRSVAIMAGLLYAVYPPTLYYSHLASQESLFQSFFVISFYWLCAFNDRPGRRNLFLFSVFFTLALLTKSHILLMIPFVVAMIALSRQAVRTKVVDIALLMCVIGLLTMPYGLYNLQVNKTYVFASSGSGGFFLTGHNDDFYSWLIDTPPKGTPEFKRLADLRFSAFSKDGIPADVAHKQRQAIYLERGLRWVAGHPIKALNLLVHNLWHHLQPGYSLRFHDSGKWLAAMVVSLPIYLFAYIELVKTIGAPRPHLPAYIVSGTMLLFSLVFYAQNRFRLITAEPVYVLYSAPFFVSLLRWLRCRSPAFLLRPTRQ